MKQDLCRRFDTPRRGFTPEVCVGVIHNHSQPFRNITQAGGSVLEEVQSLCRDIFKLWVRHPTTLAGHPQAHRRVPNETKPKPRIPKLWDKTLRCRRICVRGNGRIHPLALLVPRIPDDAGKNQTPSQNSKTSNRQTQNSEFQKMPAWNFGRPETNSKNHFRIPRRPTNLSQPPGRVWGGIIEV